MSERILLSPIRNQGRALKTPEQGSWHSDPNFLRSYSSDILLEGAVDDRLFVQSVPSVFARPLQFYRAFEDDTHPAHPAVIGQWRGLLAIFALRKWLDVSLEAREYRTRDTDQEGLAPETLRKGDGPFRAILRGQMPSPAADWDQWWFLRCEGVLIGATSPWSLAYTPAEQRCPERIPWQRKGVLMDPEEYYSQQRIDRPRELSLLGVWLDRVRRRLEDSRWSAEKPHLEAPLRAVNRELGIWAAALSRFRDASIGSPDLSHSLALIQEEPFRSVVVPLDVEQVDTPSDLLLDTRSGRSVLAFSRDGIRPEKRVYGSVSAGDVDLKGLPESERAGGWTTRSGRSVPWPYVIAEEVFFPPKLTKLEVSDHAASGGSAHYALPLTTRCFQYFDLATLTQGKVRIDIEEDDRRVLAVLHLPLKGGGTLTVKRSYDRATDLIDAGDDAPAIYLWPDFADSRWKHNFALISAPASGGLAVAPLTLAGEALVASLTDGSEQTFRIWNHAEPLAGFVLLSGRDSEHTEEAGLVLRRAAPALARKLMPDWKVAVDFGTSSTNLLLQEGTAPSRPLVFHNRTLVLARGAEAFETELSRRFYPAEEVRPPFPTLLTRNEATLVEGQPNSAATGETLLPRFAVSYIDFFFRNQLSHIVKDLKWSSRGGTTQDVPIREYLSAVARAVCCEAFASGCRSVAFSWSYPLALPVHTRESMSSFWQGSASEFSVPGELAVRAEAGVSESDAFCRFLAATPLAALPLLANSLSVAVDIGGGSTDIAFWSEARLLGQVSLKLAGNDILVPLVRLPRFWAELVKACDAGRAIGEDEQEKLQLEPGVVLNALLTQARDGRGKVFAGDPVDHPLPAALASRLHHAEPPWSIARSLIHLFTVGISFYVGLHARKWLSQLEVRHVSLRFGGRGAALFPWLARNTQLRSLIEAAFREGVSLDCEENRTCGFSVAAPGLSSDPRSPLKGEVVRGLLLEPLSSDAPQRSEKTLVGEVGWRLEGGASLAWDAEVGPAEIRKLLPPPNHASGFAAHFLQRVVPKQAEDLGLDAEGLRAIDLNSAAIHHYLRAGIASGLEVLQPVFAVELKVMMEDYLQKALGQR